MWGVHQRVSPDSRHHHHRHLQGHHPQDRFRFPHPSLHRSGLDQAPFHQFLLLQVHHSYWPRELLTQIVAHAAQRGGYP